MELNTSKIRRISRSLLQCSDSLNSDAVSGLKKLQTEVSSEFEGEAATALLTALRNEQTDGSSIVAALRDLGNMLSRYADRLEEADERLSKLL